MGYKFNSSLSHYFRQCFSYNTIIRNSSRESNFFYSTCHSFINCYFCQTISEI